MFCLNCGRMTGRFPPCGPAYRMARLGENFVSVLVFGELRHGIERLRARDAPTASHLERWLDSVREQFETQILPVNLEIVDLYGRLSPGQRLPPFDGLMAATALVHDLTLVTRNTRHFERSGRAVAQSVCRLILADACSLRSCLRRIRRAGPPRSAVPGLAHSGTVARKTPGLDGRCWKVDSPCR